jgi:cell division protease FtsH
MGSFQNVASNLTAADPIVKASIVPRGVDALGHTIQRPSEDRFLLAESELKNRIAVLMGGRAAESLVFEGNVSTGAVDDLQCAIEFSLEMVTRYGMDKKVGQRTYAPVRQNFLLGIASERIHVVEKTDGIIFV